MEETIEAEKPKKRQILSIIAVVLDGEAFALYGAGVGLSYASSAAAFFAALFCYLFAVILPVAAIGYAIAGLSVKPRTRTGIILSVVAIALPVLLLTLAILLSNNGVGLITFM